MASQQGEQKQHYFPHVIRKFQQIHQSGIIEQCHPLTLFQYNSLLLTDILFGHFGIELDDMTSNLYED